MRDDRARAHCTKVDRIESARGTCDATAVLADDDDNIKTKAKKDNPIGDVERFVCLDSSERRASWEVGPVSKKRKEERVRGRSETPRLLAGGAALVTGSWELGNDTTMNGLVVVAAAAARGHGVL